MPRRDYRAEARDRANRALRLRLAGASYESIAAAVGYNSGNTAYKAVNSILAKTARDSGKELLDLELDRLDRAQNEVWRLALRGDLKAVNTLLRIMEHRAKLARLYDDGTQAEAVNMQAAFAGLLSLAVQHPAASVTPPGSPFASGNVSTPADDTQAPQPGVQGEPGQDAG